jgi:hypothetical protein
MNANTINPMSFRYAALMVAALVLITGCKKEFDKPPVTRLPVGHVLTVQELRDMLPATVQSRKFTGDSSVFAVVTADEQSGNLYRNVFVQDHTAAIQLRMQTPGGLYQGDSIRIYLKGTIVSRYQGMLQLDSVDVDYNVVKQATLVPKAPLELTLHQLDSLWNTPGGSDSLQAKLLKITDVEFKMNEACEGATYANAVTQSTVNRTLVDCAGNDLDVRTSGYASFAGRQLPTGHGSIIGVLGQFQSGMQFFIRNINEVQMNDPERCVPCPTACEPTDFVQEEFSGTAANIDIALPCWNNEPVSGSSRRWRGTSLSGNMAAQATAFQSTAQADTTWLITPPVNYSPGTTLSFRTQRGFGSAGHDPFALFISTNYLLNDPNAATWTPVEAMYATASTADQVWVPSGAIDLGQYLPAGHTGRFVIGFRYSGSGPNGRTTNFRIDDVVID